MLILIFLFLIFLVFVVSIISPWGIEIMSIWLLFGGGGLYLILGLVLLVLVRRSKITGGLRTFLQMTGLAATVFLPFAILHNLFYGVAEYVDVFIIEFFARMIESSCFLIAVLVSPILFLVGAIGSVVLYMGKGKPQ